MRRYRWVWVFCILALGGTGCIGGPAPNVSPDFKANPPRSIAVLPVLNETVNLKAPEVLRPVIFKRLSQKGYEVPAAETIDQKLLEKEIREAGQINSVTPQELGKILGADALLYSTVTECSTTYLVVYASMTVGARFWLVDAKTGDKIWESDHEVKEKKLGLDSRSIQDTISFAALQAYQPYMEQVVDTCLATLPNGPLYSGTPAGGCLMPATK